jgi:choice-of-anchor C domain-containing protein
MKAFLKTIICVACLLGVTAHGELIVNGSFESGSNPGSSAQLTAVDSTSITGWLVATGNVDYIGTRWTAGDGTRCIDLNGSSSGVIAQSLSCLFTGQTYRLTFLMAGNPEGGGSLKKLRVHVGTVTQDFQFDITGKTTSSMGWVTNTLDFTASATSLTLSFESLTSGIYGPAVDRVSIKQITTNELVINGSFESGSDPGSSAQVTAVDASTITGWIVDSGNVDYIGTRWTAGDGSRCIDLNGTGVGSISQTLSCLVTGVTYRLTFLMAGNPEGTQGVKTMTVSVGGAEQNYEFDTTGYSTSNLGWVTKTLDFVALSTSLVLTFESTSSGAGLFGPAIDRVSVKNVP